MEASQKTHIVDIYEFDINRVIYDEPKIAGEGGASGDAIGVKYDYSDNMDGTDIGKLYIRLPETNSKVKTFEVKDDITGNIKSKTNYISLNLKPDSEDHNRIREIFHKFYIKSLEVTKKFSDEYRIQVIGEDNLSTYNKLLVEPWNVSLKASSTILRYPLFYPNSCRLPKPQDLSEEQARKVFTKLNGPEKEQNCMLNCLFSRSEKYKNYNTSFLLFDKDKELIEYDECQFLLHMEKNDYDYFTNVPIICIGRLHFFTMCGFKVNISHTYITNFNSSNMNYYEETYESLANRDDIYTIKDEDTEIDNLDPNCDVLDSNDPKLNQRTIMDDESYIQPSNPDNLSYV